MKPQLILWIFASQFLSVKFSVSQVNNRARYTFQNSANVPLDNGSSVFKQFHLKDNSTLLLLKILEKDNGGKINEIITLQKLDVDGNVIWNKKIDATLTGHQTSVENAVLLANESVLLAGSFTNKTPISNKTNRSKIFIFNISPNGIITWNKCYSLNTNPDQPNLLSGHSLFEMADKSLILTATRFINDISVTNATYRLAIKFDRNGNQLWENQYRLLNIDEQGHMNPAIAEVDNRLLLYNNVASTCTDENDPDCFSYESFAAVVTLNPQTGAVTSSKKIKHIGTPPPESLFGTKNSDHSHNTHQIFSNDTTIKLFNYFRRFTNDGNKCRIGFLVTLNKSLEVLNTSEISVNNFGINPNANNYMYVSLTNNFTADGALLINITGAKAKSYLGEILKEDSLRYYFAKINARHNLQWQKKIAIFSPAGQPSTAPSLLETENCKTQIAFGYVNRNEQTNGKFNIELLRFNPLLNFNTNCFTTDTNFIEIKNTAAENSDLSYNEQLNSNLFVQGTAVFDLTDAQLPSKEIICENTNDCNNTKISGPDTVCANSPFIILTKKNSNCYSTLEWDIPQQITDTTHINDSTLEIIFKQSWQGNIYLKTAGCDSVLLDSLFIVVKQQPLQPELGNDTMLCDNQTIPLNAGHGFRSYLWNTGATDSVIYVSSAGVYSIKATDFCDNVFQDTIIVQKQDSTFLLNYSNVTICKGDTIVLSATPGFYDYIWYPSTFLLNSFARETVAFPATTTTYSVRAKRFVGCELEQFVTVKVEECAETIFIPNSFTPNGDGVNDEFKPIVYGDLIVYEFLIYNRFGQIVFNSIQKSKGWNGVFRNYQQPVGLYTWVLKYQFKNKRNVTKSGTVTLIR